MPIDRAFSVKGFGTVVTGTLLSGRVGVDDELALLPGERRVKVRGVQVHGETAASGQAGQRVALNLGGIDLDEIGRGDSLLTPGTLRRPACSTRGCRSCRASVRFGTARACGSTRAPARRSAAWPWRRCWSPTARIAARTEQPGQGPVPPRCRAERTPTSGSGSRRQPSCLAGTGSSCERIRRRSRLRAASCWTRIRREAPSAPRRRASASSGWIPGSAGGHAAEDRAVAALVAEAGSAGFDTPSLVSRAGLDPGSVDEVIGRLVRAGSAVRAGAVLLTPAVIDALASGVLKRLTDHHRAEPLSEGLPREEVRERVFARAGEGVFDAVIARLQQDGTVVGRDRLALASHRVLLTPAEESRPAR